MFLINRGDLQVDAMGPLFNFIYLGYDGHWRLWLLLPGRNKKEYLLQIVRGKFILLIAFLVLSLAFAGDPAFPQGPGKKPVSLIIKGKKITVEVVRTEKEKAKGLMFRETLGQDEGMLFVYEEEGRLSFWMKNTRMALSIAFIDKNGKIVDIQDMEPFNLKTHVAAHPAQYALEMNKGWFQRLGIGIGDSVKFLTPLQSGTKKAESP